MARRKQRRQLAEFISPDRFVVVNMKPHGAAKACRKRVFTSYGDAAKVTLHCSRSRQAEGGAPCFLLQGWAGAEKLVGRCSKGKCGKPKAGDYELIASCTSEYTAKKARRELIKARATVPHHTSVHKAAKTRTSPREDLPPGLRGKRKKQR